MSFCIIVTLFACIAQIFVSSNNPIRKASAAVCKANIACTWNLKSFLKSCAISLTNRWKGNFLINKLVDFWKRRISRIATVPGFHLCGGFLIPTGADLRAALVANCLRGL